MDSLSAVAGLMPALDSAATGLSAASTLLNVTANNIANLTTPGFQSQRADFADLSGGGVQLMDVSTDAEKDGDTQLAGSGNDVDLAQQMVNLKQANLLYDANAQVIKTEDRVVGTLLDVMNGDRQGNN